MPWGLADSWARPELGHLDRDSKLVPYFFLLPRDLTTSVIFPHCLMKPSASCPSFLFLLSISLPVTDILVLSDTELKSGDATPSFFHWFIDFSPWSLSLATSSPVLSVAGDGREPSLAAILERILTNTPAP